jgi:hypothetical protein
VVFAHLAKGGEDFQGFWKGCVWLVLFKKMLDFLAKTHIFAVELLQPLV